MNKKGFLSTSMVYSFFLVFLLMLLFIVASMINNRILVSRIVLDIKEDIYGNDIASFIKDNASDTELIYKEEIDSYRYVGANPNNYVCFGSNISPCPSDNLYRIIGIINNQVKIIKVNSINVTTNYTPKELLNYLNSGDTSFYATLNNKNNINKTMWYSGAVSDDIIQIFKEVYNTEMNINLIDEWIGLPYLSDYLGASDGTDNWLKVNNTLFLTQHLNDYGNNEYYYLNNGVINYTSNIISLIIRPVFSLKNYTAFNGGNGSQTNPFVIGG